VPDGVVQERWDDLWGARGVYVDVGVKVDVDWWNQRYIGQCEMGGEKAKVMVRGGGTYGWEVRASSGLGLVGGGHLYEGGSVGACAMLLCLGSWV